MYIIQIEANSDENMEIEISEIQPASLNIEDVNLTPKASSVIIDFDHTISLIDESRPTFEAQINRRESAITNFNDKELVQEDTSIVRLTHREILLTPCNPKKCIILTTISRDDSLNINRLTKKPL